MNENQQTITLGKTGWFNRLYSPRIKNFFSPHLLIVGQTGAGKSTTLQKISQQLDQQKQAQLIFDPTGEFTAAGPEEKSYTMGKNVFFDLSQLSATDLLTALDLKWPANWQTLLSQAQTALRINQHLLQDQSGVLPAKSLDINHFYQLQGQLYPSQWSYPLTLLGQQLRLLGQSNFFIGDPTKIVQDKALTTAINDLAERLASPLLKSISPNLRTGQTKYDLLYLLKLATAKASFGAKISINLSHLKELGSLQATMMSVVWQQLLNFQAVQTNKTTIILLIDEGHRFLLKQDKINQSTDMTGLGQILREGRKEGLAVAFSSQSPLDLPPALTGQFSTVITHRLTNPNEWLALPLFAPSQKLNRQVSQLPTGQCIIKVGQQPARAVKITAPS